MSFSKLINNILGPIKDVFKFFEKHFFFITKPGITFDFELSLYGINFIFINLFIFNESFKNKEFVLKLLFISLINENNIFSHSSDISLLKYSSNIFFIKFFKINSYILFILSFISFSLFSFSNFKNFLLFIIDFS